MDFQTLMRRRYSARGYRGDPVEKDKLLAVLEAARLAPTAANRQPFQIIVTNTKNRGNDLRRIYDKDWFVQAPLVLAAIGLPEQAWRRHDGRNYVDVDVSIVVDHITLAAADLGLATCWIGAFNVPAAREILGLPDEVEPIAFTPLGYSDAEPRPKTRKELTELVRYDNW